MSLADQVATILGQIPALFASAGLQVRLLTSPPSGDVTQRTYAAWTPLVGHFLEHSQATTQPSERNAWIRRRLAYLSTAAANVFSDGSQISFSSAAPLVIWSISGQPSPHEVMPGIIRYTVYRDEPLYTDAQRHGGL